VAGDLLAVQAVDPRRWTKADIADAVREWTAKHGRLPADRDWRSDAPTRHDQRGGPKPGWPDPDTVRTRLGGFEEAAFFAFCGREWKHDVIDPQDPTVRLRRAGLDDAVKRLLIAFLADVNTGATRPQYLSDPRWGTG
jgi:hypothetical protein